MEPREPSLRRLYSELREGEYPDEITRQRLRRRVFESWRAPVATRPLVWSWRLTLPVAAAALVVVAVGLLFYSDTASVSAPDPMLQIQANGGVHLRWTDVGRADYRILRSTDPNDFSRAWETTVQGNTFVDVPPSEAQVVYYRVE